MVLNGDKCDTTTASDESEIYYGIWYPKNSSLDLAESKELPLVVTNYEDVKVLLKKYKGCRFKRLQTHEEALAFANLPPDQIIATPVASIKKTNGEDANLGEKGTIFRAPTRQEVVELRTAIQRGDAVTFKRIVWNNPRYLIGNADNPTIFQEGFRYNALHIAAQAKQPAMCTLILETVENPDFMKLMYGDDKPIDRIRKVNYLVDLYLNMRDKGDNETPLHIAAKFGTVEVVSVLAAHPVCDKTLENKYGKTAKDTAFSRCQATAEQQSAMNKAFEEKYFVAILSDNDESSIPYVSKPLSSAVTNQMLESSPSQQPTGRKLSPSVRAIAGPMSIDQAKDFQKLVKSPHHLLPPKSFRSIKLSDLEKGYERIARRTAKDLKVDWKEKWPFGYCDVTSPSGLRLMDDYLKQKISELHSQDFKGSGNVNDTELVITPISHLCKKFESLTLASIRSLNACSPVLSTDTFKSVNSMEPFMYKLCKNMALLLSRDLHEQIENRNNLKSVLFSDALPIIQSIQQSTTGDLSSIYETIAQLIAEDLVKSFSSQQLTDLQYSLSHQKDVLLNKNDQWEYLQSIFNQLALKLKHVMQYQETVRTDLVDDDDNSSVEEYFTPPTSPNATISSSPTFDDYESPEENIALFLNGMCPSKLDLDVLRALNDTYIDSSLYPNVHKWKILILSYSKEETESWRTPGTPKRKLNEIFKGSPSSMPVLKLNNLSDF